MPSDNHNEATSHVVQAFCKWAADWKGCATADHNVLIDQSRPVIPAPKRQRRVCQPDCAFWGFPNCERREKPNNALMPKKANPPKKIPKVSPDVVIQFSWRKGKDYEMEALNDIMNRTAEAVAGNSPPRLGYLIKVHFGTSRKKAGFDVYRVPRGTTVADAENNRNGAQKLIYNEGEHDVVIKITPEDLGIPVTGFRGKFQRLFCGDFEISMKQLYEAAGGSD